MPAYTEPVTVSEAKLYMRIDDDNTAEDSLIAMLISSSREFLEGRLGLSLVQRNNITQNFRRECCGRQIGEVFLKWMPVRSEVVIKDLQGNTIEVENIGSAEFPKYCFSYPVDVTYSAGYEVEDFPADIKRAILMIVATGYKDRENTTEQASNLVRDNALKMVQPFSRNVF